MSGSISPATPLSSSVSGDATPKPAVPSNSSAFSRTTSSFTTSADGLVTTTVTDAGSNVISVGTIVNVKGGDTPAGGAPGSHLNLQA